MYIYTHRFNASSPANDYISPDSPLSYMQRYFIYVCIRKYGSGMFLMSGIYVFVNIYVCVCTYISINIIIIRYWVPDYLSAEGLPLERRLYLKDDHIAVLNSLVTLPFYIHLRLNIFKYITYTYVKVLKYAYVYMYIYIYIYSYMCILPNPLTPILTF
jgi:hypothetical protein